MERGRMTVFLAAALLLMRLLLPGAAKCAAEALRAALTGERDWTAVEALGRSVTEGEG